jgi:hypothetical protein
MKNKSIAYYMAERKAKDIGSSLTPDAAIKLLKEEYKGKFDLILSDRIIEMINEMLRVCFVRIDAVEIQKAVNNYFGGFNKDIEEEICLMNI